MVMSLPLQEQRNQSLSLSTLTKYSDHLRDLVESIAGPNLSVRSREGSTNRSLPTQATNSKTNQIGCSDNKQNYGFDLVDFSGSQEFQRLTAFRLLT